MVNDLTVPTTGALSVPGRGFERGVDRSDLIIPRAKMLQGLSPEIMENRREGLRVGQIINSLTLETLPSRFVPIFYWKEWFRFNPRSRDKAGWTDGIDPGALIWRSKDADDPRVVDEAAWGEDGETPLAMTVLNFFSLFNGVPMPLVISFAKTSYKAGKQLLSLTRFCGGDMFSRAYQLSSTMQKNGDVIYYTAQVTALGESDAAERTQAEAWWSTFAQKADLKVHEERREPGDDLEV